MKKKILIALSLVAVVALSIGGTVAFLTSKDTTSNVFTIGEVKIELLSNDLSSVTEDGKILLMPNNTDKIAADYRIKNTGKSDAYVWLRLYIPTNLEDAPGLAANNIIHWNVPGAFWNGYQTNATYIASAVKAGYLPEGTTTPVDANDTWLMTEGNNNMYTKTIDGVKYNVYDIMYKGALEAGETTNIGVSTIFMDERVDYVDGKWALVENGVVTPIEFDFNSGASVKVEAHAIQANGFDNVQDAYAAYQKQWAE